MRYQDKLVGLLAVGCRQARTWSSDETTLMVTISEIMATYRGECKLSEGWSI